MTRFAAGAACIALVLAGGSYAGTSGDAVVRITVVSQSASGTSTTDAVANPLPNGEQVLLAAVLSLLPMNLPAAVAQQPGCSDPETVTVRFASGRAVSYGPCGLPQQISRLARTIVWEAPDWSALLAKKTIIAGARAPERREVLRLLKEIGPTRISHIEFRPLRRDEVSWKVDAGTSQVSEWESGLLAQLYLSASSSLHLRPVGGLEFPTGVGVGITAGDIGLFGDLGPVQRIVLASGARIVKLRQMAGAVEVFVRAPNPAVFLKDDGVQFIEALRSFGAAFWAVEDANGSIVVDQGWLPGFGMSFEQPDLVNCGPTLADGTGRGYSPPCPA